MQAHDWLKENAERGRHSPRSPSCSEVGVLEDPTLCGLFTLPARTRAECVQCLRGCARHTKERGVEESSGAVGADDQADDSGEASRRD